MQSLPVTPVLVVVSNVEDSNVEEVHVGKTVAYKKILGAMFLVDLCQACMYYVLCTSYGSFKRRSQVLIEGVKNKLFATTEMRRICMGKQSRNDEIPSTVDTLIRNAVPTCRTMLHRLPRGR